MPRYTVSFPYATPMSSRRLSTSLRSLSASAIAASHLGVADADIHPALAVFGAATPCLARQCVDSAAAEAALALEAPAADVARCAAAAAE